MNFPDGIDSNFSIKMLVNNTKYTTYSTVDTLKLSNDIFSIL